MFSGSIVSFLADAPIFVIALLGAYALLFRLKPGPRLAAYARIAMAGLTAFLVARLVGSIYQPAAERPFELLGVAAGASSLNNPGFPSDHALFAMAITLAVWCESRMKRTAIVLFVLTILMCVGRVLALVHTPLDVAGGMLVACLGALWYLQRTPQTISRNTKSLPKIQ